MRYGRPSPVGRCWPAKQTVEEVFIASLGAVIDSREPGRGLHGMEGQHSAQLSRSAGVRCISEAEGQATGPLGAKRLDVMNPLKPILSVNWRADGRSDPTPNCSRRKAGRDVGAARPRGCSRRGAFRVQRNRRTMRPSRAHRGRSGCAERGRMTARDTSVEAPSEFLSSQRSARLR